VDANSLGSAAPLVTVATDPDKEIEAFARQADDQDVENVVIGCCEERGLFEQALGARRLAYLDLKGRCFAPHSDPAEAHGKALRMIAAAKARSDAQVDVPQNLLQVGGRVLIFTDSSAGLELAEKIKGLEEVTVLVAPEARNLEELPAWRVNRGRIGAIVGRVGGFEVTVEPHREEGARPRSPYQVEVDQVAVVAETSPAFKQRTGLHLIAPGENGNLEHAAQQVRELVGLFHKPEHLAYDTEICAGGAAGMKTCGRCIPSCPYDAIARDSENELRVRVDHLTCEGCGACVSACPTSALRFTAPSPGEIYGQLTGYLAGSGDEAGSDAPPVVVFHCEEMGRRVLEEAGSRPLPYSAAVLPVEVPCLRYVSEANMLQALRMGAAGVGLLGCENCPNGERELLFEKMEFTQQVLGTFGLGGERVRLITADEGQEAEAVEVLNRFAVELAPTPCRSDGKPPRHTGNREVVAEAIAGFIGHTGKEPGGIRVPQGQDYAFAEVADEGCTLCRSCINVCPTHAFKFDEDAHTLYYKHISCVGCGLCEQACPEKVIKVRPELYLESQSLDYLAVVEDEIITCARCEAPYINKRALEAIEAKVLNMESLLDTFTGKRRNLLRMCPDCRAVSAMWEVHQGWQP
jgi:ferredoxin